MSTPRDGLACYGCGSTAGMQHGVAGRWLCGGCLVELAAWALENGAPLAPGAATERTQEVSDEHTD